MLEKSSSIDYIVCSNDREALLIEQQMIKLHQPFYNILLLDDKKYPFIVVEKQSQKINISIKYQYRENKNCIYYGPVPKGYGLKIIKNLLIRECLYEKGLPITTFDKKTLNEKFSIASKILSSSNIEFIRKLKLQMEEASENEQYEIAKDLRDQILFLSNKTSQGVEFNVDFNFDVIAFEEKKQYISIIVHSFKKGVFSFQEEHIIELFVDIHESILSFLNQFYQKRNKPKMLVLNYDVNKNELLINAKILVPKRGKYKLALDNALKNSRNNIDLKIQNHINNQNQINEVENFIFSNVHKKINDILMVDTSSFGNKDIVCAIIYYRNYKPLPSQYRKYIINDNLERKSDVEYMKEGITKYFSNDLNLKPDLIIVDGGKQQINEVKKVVNCIPVVGLVKNQKHKTNHFLNTFNKKIILKSKAVYNFFSKMQEEVDYYAKKFHRKKKIQNSLDGFLLSIKGIGPATEKKLLQHFKYYSCIFNATNKELSEIIGPKIAKKITNKILKMNDQEDS